MRKLEPIGAIIKEFLLKSGLKEQMQSADILTLWEEVTGPVVAKNSQAMTFKDGTLFVEVESSVWLQQLTCLKYFYIEKLNEQLGSQLIQDIFFKITDQAVKPIWYKKHGRI